MAMTNCQSAGQAPDVVGRAPFLDLEAEQGLGGQKWVAS